MIALLCGLAAAGAAGTGVLFNRIRRRAAEVDSARSQVDVELRRRHDLIPNLVAVTAGHAAHERGTLVEVTRARGAARAAIEGGPVVLTAGAEVGLGRALDALADRVDGWPDLKADVQFIALWAELVRAEDRLARARQAYNDAVYRLRCDLRQFPHLLVAPLAYPAAAPPFLEEAALARRVPAVRFS